MDEKVGTKNERKDVRRLVSLLLVTALVGIVIWFFLAHVSYSISPSVGAHIFWRTTCPAKTERYQLVEVIPQSNDPFLPFTKARYAKHIVCLPGETVIRKGLEFFCKTKEGMIISLGKTKLKARDGRPLRPFMYDQGEEASYKLKKDEFFVIGDKSPHSYDSRYYGPVPKERIAKCLQPLL